MPAARLVADDLAHLARRGVSPRAELAVHDLLARRLPVLDLHDRRGRGRSGGSPRRVGLRTRREREGKGDYNRREGGQGRYQCCVSSSAFHVEPPVGGRAQTTGQGSVDYRHATGLGTRFRACGEESEGVRGGPPVLPQALGEQAEVERYVRAVTLQDFAQV